MANENVTGSPAWALALGGIVGSMSVFGGLAAAMRRDGPFDAIIRSLIVERGEPRTAISAIIHMVRDTAIELGRWEKVRRRRGVPRILRYIDEYTSGTRVAGRPALLDKAVDDAIRAKLPKSLVASYLAQAAVAVGQAVLCRCQKDDAPNARETARHLGRAVSLIIQSRNAALEDHYQRILPSALGVTPEEVAAMLLRTLPIDIASKVVRNYESLIGGEQRPDMPTGIEGIVTRGRAAAKALARIGGGPKEMLRISREAEKLASERTSGVR